MNTLYTDQKKYNIIKHINIKLEWDSSLAGDNVKNH